MASQETRVNIEVEGAGQAKQWPATMRAVRLHGPADMRVETVRHPGPPERGQVLLRVTAVGICGSDLHTYSDGGIGDARLKDPFILGHEFAGVVEAAGPEALDGNFQPLRPGTRVAVDPAQPCGHCELCEQGHPNLCENLHFCGQVPDDHGALCEWIRVPARTCFPVPESIDDVGAALLETLGVAIHATDLARIRVGDSVAIIGAGPVGLCILQTVKLAGADPIFVTDKLPWRCELARRFGATVIEAEQVDAVQAIRQATSGRGVDVAIEAAWCDESAQQAAEMLRLGGRLVIVGIPGDDKLEFKHGTVRRKGLTIRICRRMKHAYPRAIRLAAGRAVDLHSLISHRFSLDQAPQAFAMNAEYRDGVVKAVIEVHSCVQG